MPKLPILFLTIAFGTPAVAQDAAKGQQQFAARCAGCHNIQRGGPSGAGPNLADLAGQKSGTRTAYASSAALKKAAITWSPATLDAFLAAPMKTVPGTRMVIATPDPAMRASLVAYLLSVK